MGYTHYFQTKRITGKTKENEKLFKKAIKDCNKIIKAYYKENKGTYKSLSGYSAHAPIGVYGGLNLNGKGSAAHETFFLKEHFNQNFEFNFCKTARKPYDLVVVACLSVLKFHLGPAFMVSSDGNYNDWTDGVEFANKVLRRTKNKIINPIEYNVKTDLYSM